MLRFFMEGIDAAAENGSWLIGADEFSSPSCPGLTRASMPLSPPHGGKAGGMDCRIGSCNDVFMRAEEV